jgi:hypothetical protein
MNIKLYLKVFYCVILPSLLILIGYAVLIGLLKYLFIAIPVFVLTVPIVLYLVYRFAFGILDKYFADDLLKNMDNK